MSEDQAYLQWDHLHGGSKGCFLYMIMNLIAGVDEVVFRSHKLMVDDSLARSYLKEGVLRSLHMYNPMYIMPN